MEANKEILYKNNRIIKAKYDLTTIQNRVYQYILYKMQQNSLNNSTGIYEAYINISEFKNIIKPIYEEVELNQSNILDLKSLRDELLPKLMSGEIK